MSPILYSILTGPAYADQLPYDASGTPQLVVQDTKYEKIYIQKPVIKGNDREASFNSEEEIFVYMNMHAHLIEKNISVYNDTNISFLYQGCDYTKHPLSCSVEHNHWMLQPMITLDKDRHTISLLLYNEHGEVVAQSSKGKKRKIKYLNKKSSTISVGEEETSSVDYEVDKYRVKIPIAAAPTKKTEEFEPVKVEEKPLLTEYEIHQAVMMLCLSVK